MRWSVLKSIGCIHVSINNLKILLIVSPNAFFQFYTITNYSNFVSCLPDYNSKNEISSSTLTWVKRNYILSEFERSRTKPWYLTKKIYIIRNTETSPNTVFCVHVEPNYPWKYKCLLTIFLQILPTNIMDIERISFSKLLHGASATNILGVNPSPKIRVDNIWFFW